MSKTDIFSKYSQLYQKTTNREIVPEGAFTRQLADVPTHGLDVGIFFKQKGIRDPRQIYFQNELPVSVAKKDGFLESTDRNYLSHSVFTKFKELDYLKVVVGSNGQLESRSSRTAFLKACQKTVDVVLRKAKNVIHFGDFTPFLFAQRVRTLDWLLNKDLKLDEISAEAAAIPFNVAAPEYLLLTGDNIISVKDNPVVRHGVFYLVGGIGYSFDTKVGAVNEERMFRTTADLNPMGIDEAYIETMISRVTEDFQTNVHSLMFSDIWKKSPAKPLGVNIGGDILIKPAEGSEIWNGVLEVYLKTPST
ncbi:MAG: hypothetical protein ACW98Y_18200 [Candidatus Thorarchaeota archaeon]|jgi:hypothetical protein